MSRVLLRPSLFFDPAQTGWTSVSQFESWFARKLAESGLEGEVVPTIPSQELVFLIKAKPMASIPDVSNMTPKQMGRPKSLKSHIESLAPKTETAASRAFKKGKFLKSKGYLKKET